LNEFVNFLEKSIETPIIGFIDLEKADTLVFCSNKHLIMMIDEKEFILYEAK